MSVVTIGDRIKYLRGRKSMAEFGTEIGVSAQQISRIETDQSKPSFDLAEKICEKYNVSLDWLMRGIEHSPKPATDPNTITISKDEFIELQRKALRQEEEKNKKLENEVQQLKNG